MQRQEYFRSPPFLPHATHINAIINPNSDPNPNADPNHKHDPTCKSVYESRAAYATS